jgi:hypothetical protein
MYRLDLERDLYIKAYLVCRRLVVFFCQNLKTNKNISHILSRSYEVINDYNHMIQLNKLVPQPNG